MLRAPLLQCAPLGDGSIYEGLTVKNTFLACHLPRLDGLDLAVTQRCSSVPARFKPSCHSAPPSRSFDARTMDASVKRWDEPTQRTVGGRRKPRPTKNQRELYRRLVGDWEQAFLRDPTRFSFDSVTIPEGASPDPEIRAWLLERLLARLRCLEAQLA